jgi:hypothetical protein
MGGNGLLVAGKDRVASSCSNPFNPQVTFAGLSPAHNFVTHNFVLAAVIVAAAVLDVRGPKLPVSQAVWQLARRMKLAA